MKILYKKQLATYFATQGKYAGFDEASSQSQEAHQVACIGTSEWMRNWDM